MPNILGVRFVICAFLLVLIPEDILAVSADTKGKVHEMFEMVGQECIKEYPITEDDISKLRGKKPIEENAQCFVACVLKKIGLFDENGMLQHGEDIMQKAKDVFEGDELKAIGDFLNSCSGVNAEPVSDGAKGCDRAGKAYKCMNENASQFGFDF